MVSKKIIVSGSFDSIHPGYIAMLEAAAKYGEVHVILNSDQLLVDKKGFFFQSWEDRKKILEVYTPHIYKINNYNDDLRELLIEIKPDMFGLAGDNVEECELEIGICESLGIEVVQGLGGKNFGSYSHIGSQKRVATRWGSYDVLINMGKLKVKLLHISPGKKLSLQRHGKRSEFFFTANGEVKINLPGVWHAPKAPENEGLTILEVQVGISEESDIEKIAENSHRYEDELKDKVYLNS